MPLATSRPPAPCPFCTVSNCDCPCDQCRAWRATRRFIPVSTEDTESETEYETCDHCGTSYTQWGSECDCDDWCDYCDRHNYQCRCCGDCERYPCRCNVCEECECDPCECQPEGLHHYGHKPRPHFYGDGPLFMGLELEVELRRSGEIGRALQAAYDNLGDLVYCKTDGSLSNGFEIVTHPMSWPYAQTQEWGAALSDLRDAGAYAADSAGIHVHVNRSAFADPCHVYRWMKLIYRNQDKVIRAARRASDHWAPFNTSARRAIKDLAKGRTPWQLGLDRYQAINTANSNTYELRVFASTLEPATLIGTLGWVASTVDYTRSLTTQDIAHRNGWAWSSYVDYLTQRTEYAPALALLESTCAC